MCPHNPKVAGSNPAPATIDDEGLADAAAASPFRLPRIHPGIASAREDRPDQTRQHDKADDGRDRDPGMAANPARDMTRHGATLPADLDSHQDEHRSDRHSQGGDGPPEREALPRSSGGPRQSDVHPPDRGRTGQPHHDRDADSVCDDAHGLPRGVGGVARRRLGAHSVFPPPPPPALRVPPDALLLRFPGDEPSEARQHNDADGDAYSDLLAIAQQARYAAANCVDCGGGWA